MKIIRHVLPSLKTLVNLSALNRHLFVRDQVNDGKVSLTHVSSENQSADIFTKFFNAQRFNFLRDLLVVSRSTLRFVRPTKA